MDSQILRRVAPLLTRPVTTPSISLCLDMAPGIHRRDQHLDRCWCWHGHHLRLEQHQPHHCYWWCWYNTIRWGWGQTINADKIGSTITKGLFQGGLGGDSIALQANTVSGTTVEGGGGSTSSNDSADDIVVEGYGATDGSAVNVEVSASWIQGNAGADSIRVGDLTTSTVSAAANILDSTIRGGKNADYITVGAAFDITNSTIFGDAGADIVKISSARDILGGVIQGGSNTDTTNDLADELNIQSAQNISGTSMQGNAGNDTFTVSTSLFTGTTLRGGKDADGSTVTASTVNAAQIFGDRGTDTLNVNASGNISSSSIFGGSFEDTTRDGADFIQVTGEAITASSVNGNGSADTIDIYTPLFSRSTCWW